MSLLQSTIQQLKLSQLKQGERRWIGHIQGSIGSLLFSELLTQQPRLMLIVAHHSQHLTQLEDELTFYGVRPYVFPDWETLPYDRLSPHQDIISERLNLLMNMPKTGIILITAHTLMQRVSPASWLLGQHFNLSVGDQFNLQQMQQQLIQAGYHTVDTVYEHGEFAVRGSLMDIFASGQSFPIRIDLFDDTVESLRYFDPETQRTIEKLDQFVILPAKEFPFNERRTLFRERYAEFFPTTNAKRHSLYQEVMEGIASQGLEYYLPLFFTQDEFKNSCFLDYLPLTTLLITPQQIEHDIDQHWAEIKRRYHDRCHDITYPIVPPEHLFIQKHELFHCLKQYPRLIVNVESFPEEQTGSINLTGKTPPTLTIDAKLEDPFNALKQFISQQHFPILLVAESAGRRESLKDALKLQQLPTIQTFKEFIDQHHRIAITHAPLERGLWLDQQLIIITESQLYQQRIIQQQRRRKAQKEISDEFLIRSLTELTLGTPIVHIDHGVGRYAGLITLEIDQQQHEFLQLNYADDAKVYVPVTNLHLISRFSSGDPDLAPLHKLGTDTWNKAKRKALEQIHDVAAELLHTHARRQAQSGLSFHIDWTLYHQFASGFAYEETPDQANAIMTTLHDLQQARPMDRLVCGDVGFGKTEVAMRAAFVTVQNNKQVAVLVPTTLLAQQHYESFKDRFADWPIRIEVLSRFGRQSTHQKTIEDIALGKVDIVIGTHKILQESVQFKHLGLMIVDEEHRFGVRDKERIKALRANIDLLTLTATPIPRTLNMAFSGMRDLSIIATPPARRLAVKTFLHDSTETIIKEAILRELLRGGQVYFLHNNVESIERCAEKLRQLIPEARVAVAHGQMKERELERIMQQFYHKHFNVLVCSTIIETGIDIPNANTIIIEQADRFGLAQLHQLRGRVGRSHHQAYAYLLVPSVKHLKGDAEKRLDAIMRANTLGAGFMLATEDLEIRGAGELLGEQQSGSMQAIGYSLYMDLLEKTTKLIQQGKQPNFDAPLSLTADVNLHLPALIPDDYLNDVHQRLLFYKRISNANSLDKLNVIRIELIDRFGQVPNSVKSLFQIHQLRIQAEQLGICKIDFSQYGGYIDFLPDTPVQAVTIIQLLQKNPTFYRMESGQRLKILIQFTESEKRIHFVENLIKQLMCDLSRN